MILNKNYKQNIVIKHHSVYMNDEYSPMFHKLYKGVIVRVTSMGDNPQYCWFTIRTKKSTVGIFKTQRDKMESIIFNDSEHSITCNFEEYYKKPRLHTLSFEPDVYDELKTSIPEFMIECGVKSTEVVEEKGELKLIF